MSTNAPESSNERQLDLGDALLYLDAVRAEFHAQPEMYQAFLVTMQQFRANQLDITSVVDRISELFDGYPHLLQGFNVFLPKSHHIVTPTATPAASDDVMTLRQICHTRLARQLVHAQPTSRLGRVYRYMLEVKTRFAHHPETYDLFFAFVEDVVARRIDMPTATAGVSQLFATCPDLLDGWVACISSQISVEGSSEPGLSVSDVQQPAT